MHILFFDTETNGLPHVRRAPVELVENWPNIVQIAWQVLDMSGEKPHVLKRVSYIIKPSEERQWDAKSESIHGITKDRALAEGFAGKDVFGEFHKIAQLVL